MDTNLIKGAEENKDIYAPVVVGLVRGKMCPARNAECRKCKKLRYFAVACRSRVVNEVTATYEEDGGSEAHFLGEITDVDDSNDAWIVKLPIQGIEIDF